MAKRTTKTKERITDRIVTGSMTIDVVEHVKVPTPEVKRPWYSPLDDDGDVPKLPEFILEYIFKCKKKGFNLYIAIKSAPHEVRLFFPKDQEDAFVKFWMMFDVAEEVQGDTEEK